MSTRVRPIFNAYKASGDIEATEEVGQLEAMSKGQEVQPYAFVSPDGKRWDERNLRRAWYRCLEKAEVRCLRFHSLRHTSISLLIEQGAHQKYIQEQAGHSSIQVTMNTSDICSLIEIKAGPIHWATNQERSWSHPRAPWEGVVRGAES